MNSPPAKPEATAGDYLAMCACPVLIMTMVGSLVLMLLEASYSGPWLASMRWTLCWFTFAIVLVARIAIEQNRALAVCYGAALGIATAAFLSARFGLVLPVWILLGVVWWVADRVTWDCAMMDDPGQSSGQGITDRKRGTGSGEKERLVRMVGETAAPMAVAEEKRERATPSGVAAGKLKRSDKKKPGLHSPGRWVLYFAIGAVPLFGLGEILVPSQEPAARILVFWLLLAYLASATGLLLLTSFLGLRRYLRQRWVRMPPAIAVAWVNTGVWLIAGLLLAAILLPRPVTPYSLDRLVHQKPAEGSGKGGQEAAPEPKEQTDSKEPGPGQVKKAPVRTGTGKGARSGAAPGGESLRLPGWSVWLPWIVAILAALALAYRFRAELLRSLEEFLARIRSRPKKKPADRTGLFQRAKAAAPAPGEVYSNPFQTGLAAALTPAELLRYTFEAAKAWATRRGTKPEGHETPVEFAERLSRREPALEREILLLSRYYSHLAYAGRLPPPEAEALLRKLWALMTFN